MWKRNIRAKLEQSLTWSPVVLLTGARQSGKTTLAQELAQEKGYEYISFDDVRIFLRASQDPVLFLETLKKPVVIDEVQRLPELFLTIKQDVDQNKTPGRYLLTGSTNPLLIPRLGDSLAGRMAIIDMFPLAQDEFAGKQSTLIDDLFANNLAKQYTSISYEDLAQRLTKGGYPGIQSLDNASREVWFSSYLRTLLERDVQELSQIKTITELPLLLSLLAARTGNVLNVSSLSSEIGIPVATIHRHLSLLKALYLVELQQPWHSNIEKKLTKAPKIHINDSGLLSFLLQLNLERAVPEGRVLGPLIENFVFTELRKQASWNKTHLNFFHMRTQQGVEVDIVLEDYAGNIVGIEVKGASSIGNQDFRGLKHLQATAGNKFIHGIVLYLGPQLSFGPQLTALPISALWQN